MAKQPTCSSLQYSSAQAQVNLIRQEVVSCILGTVTVLFSALGMGSGLYGVYSSKFLDIH